MTHRCNRIFDVGQLDAMISQVAACPEGTRTVAATVCTCDIGAFKHMDNLDGTLGQVLCRLTGLSGIDGALTLAPTPGDFILPNNFTSELGVKA